jgi:peptide/nickel transport system substrate-binding protein
MGGMRRQADRERLYFGGNPVVAWRRVAQRGRMDYRILGPLEVMAGDRPVELGGEKQRALLAILLLHANEPVSVDGLIDGVWGERPPATAIKTAQGYVARLRRALDGGEHDSGRSSNGVLVTRGHGYLLRVEPGELDVDRFRGLVEQGRHALALGKAEHAAGVLRAGLDLWRGPALADFAYEPFAQAAIAQAEELRLAAIEERVEADLALGRHGELVAELQALVEQHPLRERARGQLMLALYRCGRQAEALQAYQDYRKAMAEQLGLDPSPALRQLEESILKRDRSLDLPVDHQPAAAPVSERTRPGRRVARLALAGVAVVALAVIAIIVVSSRGGPAALSVIPADSVGALSPRNDLIVAQAPIGGSPSALASGPGAVWAADYNAATVSRIDPHIHTVVDTIPVDSTPSAIAVGAGDVWVANTFSGTVSRIDPAVDRLVQTITVGNGPSGVSVGDGSVWVSNSSDGTLSRIDAANGAVTRTIRLGGGASDVAAAAGAVWVSDEADGRVLRVDPQTDQVTASINVGNGPTAITVGFDSVWVANSLDGTVSRIDPQTNSVSHLIGVGQGPNAIAIGSGAVWVTNEFDSTVSRIDPTANVARTIRVGNRPQGVAVAGGLVWVGAQPGATSHRGGTLTALSHGPLGSIDPTCPTGSVPCYWVTTETSDGLTAFKRVGDSDGADVVPDLATSLPAPTAGGTTYTFQLRRGIRYSDGAPVRPGDFRHEIERVFKLYAAFAGVYYGHVVGASACIAHPARCDLKSGIVADDGANTVTFHLVTPDPELLRELALSVAVAVPSGTPDRDVGRHPVPTTGAYQIASYTPRELKLVRNPYFHVWSNAARPDGYPDQIVWRIGASPAAEVTAVERGLADYTLDPPPADRLGAMQIRFAGQLKINPNDSTVLLWLNTRVAPFTDIRVRQALNYAVDRAHVANLVGLNSRPTCQLLPPYVPGHEPYCPYTLDPSAGAGWRAPDLAKARALIDASRTQGARITIWNAYDPFLTDLNPVGRYLVSLLNQLGYRARLRTVPATDQSFEPGNSRAHIQGGLFSYEPAYPAASEFLGPQYESCQSFVPNSANNVNWAEFCDPRFDAIVRNALAADTASSPAAAGLWANADREFTDQAPMVSLVTPSTVDFISRRAGNYQYNPVWGALLDQMWVR